MNVISLGGFLVYRLNIRFDWSSVTMLVQQYSIASKYWWNERQIWSKVALGAVTILSASRFGQQRCWWRQKIASSLCDTRVSWCNRCRWPQGKNITNTLHCQNHSNNCHNYSPRWFELNKQKHNIYPSSTSWPDLPHFIHINYSSHKYSSDHWTTNLCGLFIQSSIYLCFSILDQHLRSRWKWRFFLEPHSNKRATFSYEW